MAAETVFDLLIDPALATVGYNATRGILTIHDPDGLAAYLGLDAAELRADPSSFVEDDALIRTLAHHADGRDARCVA